MYVKLFGTILDSSIWAEPAGTRLVWITMLAMADQDGYVRASRSGLARRAAVGRNECEQAINTLEGPDPESGTLDDDGKRIEPVPGGWLILNHRKYREIQTQQQLHDAIRQRKHRAKARDLSLTSQSSHARHGDPVSVSVDEDSSVNGTAVVAAGAQGMLARTIAGAVDQVYGKREVRQAKVEVVFAYWAAMLKHPNAVMDHKRQARIEARLKERDDVNELLYVVDGALRDAYLMGQNQSSKKYDGVETIFRDRGQVERLSVLGGYREGKLHPMAHTDFSEDSNADVV